MSQFPIYPPSVGFAGTSNDKGGDINLPSQRAFQGPWFSQQLQLSLSIGILSFLAFVIVRRKNIALFAPRTKLRAFSPTSSDFSNTYFGWIWPTIKTEEVRILQTVGLDAAVLLGFLKMGFWLFFFLSLWSCVILMPVNYWQNGVVDGVSPAEDQRHQNGTSPFWIQLVNSSRSRHPPVSKQPLPQPPYMTKPPHDFLYHLTHLVTIYVFTLVTLRAIWKYYHKFVRSRQLYVLELLDSIPARTVEIRHLPHHLGNEKALAEYFEAMDMKVESTTVIRYTEGLSRLLNARANALYSLERAWVKWLGNPTNAEGYDPEKIILLSTSSANHLDLDAAEQGLRDNRLSPSEYHETSRLLPEPQTCHTASGADTIRTKNPRPKQRRTWNPFSEKVDTIEELTKQFNLLDLAVKKRRKMDKFPGGTVGFVTFESAASAQIFAQTVHYPIPALCTTQMAPEPRDIIWSNVNLSRNNRRIRQVLVSIFMALLLIFYIPPLVFLASFLSPAAIKEYLPWLDRLLDTDKRLRALVQNNLPSLVLIGFNALLPLILGWTALFQGLRARSLVEYSVLKKYYLFLMVSVVFVFLITTTAWGVLQELTENPMRVIDKLAVSLPRARFFSLSYVILQSLALQPLQLLQLPTLMLRGIYRLFFTRTPREFAELNAPPVLDMGSVYPQALLIFTLCILYSVVTPLITVFGAIYFGIAYVVHKYKLLYVFYKSYESQGQAWPISARRCIWALIMFHAFQFSLFSVRKQLFMTVLMIPLLIFTVWFGRHLNRTFGPLSEHVNLSNVIEVLKQPDSQPTVDHSELAQNGPAAAAAAAALICAPDTTNHRATQSETRDGVDEEEGEEDDTLFVAQQDCKTDYREPPGFNYYPGILNTGRRRYGHPAISGILPELWLPIPRHSMRTRDPQGSSETEAEVDSDPIPTPSQPRVQVQLQTQPSDLPPSKLTHLPSTPTIPTSNTTEPLVLSLRNRKPSNVSSRFPPPRRFVSPEVPIHPDGVDGPQGSTHSAALGEVITGDQSVAPIREQESYHQHPIQQQQEEQDEGVYIHRSIRKPRFKRFQSHRQSRS